MALLEESLFLSEFFGDYGYLAAFTVLLLCGIGLPLPEEREPPPLKLHKSALKRHRGERDE